LSWTVELLSLLVGAILIALMGCAPPSNVQVADDLTVRMTDLKTYAWAPAMPPSGDPRLDDENLAASIRDAVSRQLKARGYVPQAAHADFWVRYQIALENKREVRRVTQPFGQGPTASQPFGQGLDWFQSGFSETFERQYDAISLRLDMLHPTTGQRLWHGTAPAEIRLSARPEQQDTQIDRAVQRLLARFPPAHR
jgi:Domain of unknown function (DUF4136)